MIDICLERNICRHSWRYSFKGQSGPVFSKLRLSDLGVWTLYRGIWICFWITRYYVPHPIQATSQDPLYAYEVLHDFSSFTLLNYFWCHQDIIWFHNCKPSHRHVCFPPCMLSMRFIFKFLICNPFVNTSLFFSCPIKLIILSSLHMIVMQYYIYDLFICIYLIPNRI